MKARIKELSSKLKDIHKRFLEAERLQAEDYYQKKIAPMEFLLMLTQDKNFEWMLPFSALIADIDAFADEAEEISYSDLVRIKEQVDTLFKNSGSNLVNRYQHHLNRDADFIVLHSKLKNTLNEFIGKMM